MSIRKFLLFDLCYRLVYAPAALVCCFTALSLITLCRTLEDGELQGNDMVIITIAITTKLMA